MRIYNIITRLLVGGACLISSATGCAKPGNSGEKGKDTIASVATQIEGNPDTTAGEKEQRQKRVSILGDSYSAFAGYVSPGNNLVWYYPGGRDDNKTDVRDVDEMWWKILIDRNGYVLEKNNSYSGSTICNTGYDREDYTDRSFATRLTDLGNPDIIYVLGGTNDAWAQVPRGHYIWKDWKEKDLYSYRPAVAYMVYQLQEKYPEAEITVIVNDKIDPKIVEATIKACEHYGVRCVKLENIDKISGHPSRKGMRQIADAVEK